MSSFPDADPFNEPNPFAAPLSGEAMGKQPETEVEQFRREYLSHEASIKSMGFLYLLGGAIGTIYCAFALLGLLTLLVNGQLPPEQMAVVVGIGAIVAAMTGFQLWCGWGLRKLNPDVRTPATVLAAIGLLGFPIGTLISAYFLWLLQSAKGKVVLSEQYREVVRQTPHIKYRTSIIVWIFLGLLLLLLVLGIVAAAVGD